MRIVYQEGFANNYKMLESNKGKSMVIISEEGETSVQIQKE